MPTAIETETKPTEMEQTSEQLISKALANISLNSASHKVEFECALCSDTGFAPATREKFGRVYKGVMRCECLERKRLARALSIIPPLYSQITLLNIQPDIKRHPKQGEIIELMKKNPHSSFGFTGRFGSGKTQLFWTLYREAAVMKKTCYAGTLSGLLDDYKLAIQKAQNGEFYRVKISAEDLKQDHTKYAIFLDDVDKAKPSEYAAEQLYEMVNAAYSYKHQLVWTSNLNAAQLGKHFDRADERFGGAIVRRLCEGSFYLELF